jgi:hypothetical protein
VPFEEACDEKDHHPVARGLKDTNETAEDLHRRRVDLQRRLLPDRRGDLLNPLPELGCEGEYRVVEDLGRNVVVPLLLIAHVDESVVNSHLELGGRGKLSPLVLIKLLETLKSWNGRSE